MANNEYIWTKEGYIGHNILHSNYKSSSYKVVFIGSEKSDDDNKWKVNFVYSHVSNSSTSNGGYSTNISLLVKPLEKIRFENYLGITENISVKYRFEENLNCNRFFPVQFIKLLYIEKDYIKYEVHCI